MSETQALVDAIGEYTADILGRDELAGLHVILNARDMAAFMTIALADSSDVAQKQAIKTMFEVEDLYRSEVVLTYVFVDEVKADDESVPAGARQFSLQR